MVQEARLDLIRVLAVALLTAGGARAQPLVQSSPLLQERPLTTLLQPQKLDRSRPLLPQQAAGAGTANRATPCARPGGPAGTGSSQAKPSSTPSIFGGGSGPGDYGRYLPGATTQPSSAPTTRAAPSPAPANSLPATRTTGVDRPLYGGTDRPLWDTGERRPSSGTPGKPTTGKSPQSADGEAANKDSAPSGVAAPVRDRPLWADGSLMVPVDPAARSGSAGEVAPCVDLGPSSPQ